MRPVSGDFFKTITCRLDQTEQLHRFHDYIPENPTPRRKCVNGDVQNIFLEHQVFVVGDNIFSGMDLT